MSYETDEAARDRRLMKRLAICAAVVTLLALLLNSSFGADAPVPPNGAKAWWVILSDGGPATAYGPMTRDECLAKLRAWGQFPEALWVGCRRATGYRACSSDGGKSGTSCPVWADEPQDRLE